MDPVTETTCRVSADIGGTFTDLVFQFAGTGETFVRKVLSSPADPALAVIEGLKALPEGAAVDFLIHGTTVGINSVLQRRGAKVALLTTENFRDVYTIAGNDRRDIFAIHYRKPAPLVSREHTFTIRERLRADGSVEEEPRLGDLEALVATAEARDYEAIAVCFLFSYRNPVHELAVESYLKERLPEISITLSHRISPEWREYARMSTAVMDAYVAPVIRRYLATLIAELERGFGIRQLHIMESNGGAMTAGAARQKPIQTLLSGPVGGAIGAREIARALDRPNLICVDMGGTSFDASLIVAGEPSSSSEAEIEGLPIQMSILDIHVIGAGGGSLAWLEGGHIRVGPESAGADPGPACYGRGGTQPTVTDANLVLGRIDPENFASGGITLDVAAAKRAVGTIAGELGLGLEEMAQGILDIINAKMADAIRTITIRRGIDPREFALLAYGGAGPMHAIALADQLDIAEVIVPRHPGTFSAWGMLQTDVRHDCKRTFYAVWDSVDLGVLERAFVELEEEGRGYLRREVIADRDIAFVRTADFRYRHQEYQINCEVTAGPLDSVRIREAFDEAYVAQYGHCNAEAKMEIVNLRVIAYGRLKRPPAAKVEVRPRTAPRQSDAYFNGEARRTALVARDQLAVGETVAGPAVIEEDTATTILRPDWEAVVADGGHLIITRAAD